METERILVTGGAGFIGTNLVNELRRRGHEVIALDLYNTDRDDYIRADVRNYRQLEKAFEQWSFDYVYHLAAYEGIMTEDVMEKNPIRDTYQMNDYAITKWAGELMCMNSAKMFGTETVRVRPVNCYGPGEHYTPYRGFILNLSIMPFITSLIPSLKDIRGS
jgi:dTDP-glucose 4,6-dehydratase